MAYVYSRPKEDDYEVFKKSSDLRRERNIFLFLGGCMGVGGTIALEYVFAWAVGVF